MLRIVVPCSTLGLPVAVRTASTADNPLPAGDSLGRSSVAAVLLAAAANWTATRTHPSRTQSVVLRFLLPPRRTACPAAAATPAVSRWSLPGFSDCERPTDSSVVPTRSGVSGLRRHGDDKDQSRLRRSYLSHLPLIVFIYVR